MREDFLFNDLLGETDVMSDARVLDVMELGVMEPDAKVLDGMVLDGMVLDGMVLDGMVDWFLSLELEFVPEGNNLDK